VKNVGGNLRYFDTIKLFEVGKVFRPEGKKIVEKRMISGVLSGKMIEDGAKLFYEAKGISDLLLNKMGVADYRYVGCPSGECHHWEDDRDQEFDFLFHPLQQARIKVGDKVICWVGRIDKKVLSSLGINEPAAAFELDFESLNELVEEEIAYRAPSRYPAIVRDLSVLVSPQTKIDEVLNIIENAGGELIVDTDLFDDVYEKGEQKGLTFRLVYQSDRKTLTDDEVNKSVEKIILAIEKEGWGVRK
jgi:phenylalanyl-tRNA synthetase beta chain